MEIPAIIGAGLCAIGVGIGIGLTEKELWRQSEDSLMLMEKFKRHFL